VKSFKDSGQFSEADSCYYQYRDLSQKKKSWSISKIKDLFLNEYPAACCGWDGQETDLRKTAYLHLDD
jgi:hypothetical protein